MGRKGKGKAKKGKETNPPRGKAKRIRPARLAEKLLQIRKALGLSQNQMLRKLGRDDVLDRTAISYYERGEREPPLPILLEYARAANVYMEALVGDEVDLPKKLPAGKKSEGVKRRYR
jgi:transcriptional regulator with XRE-family HTH domain